ncbi:DnaJ C-terminal domain-containing protein [Thermodesulfatator atlanticus]
MSAFDPYQILGISPEAGLDEIKRAFREKARLYHPDRGGEERLFRELKRSYEILRRRHAPAPLIIVTDRPKGGNYVLSFLDVTADELALGAEITVSIPGKPTECSLCKGLGKNPSGEHKVCEICQGKGRIFFEKEASITCPKCSGRGKIYFEICPKCHGKRVISHDEEITMKLPLGARPGDLLKLDRTTKEGFELYFELQVHENKGFYFKKGKLYKKIEVPFWEIALREEIEILTLEGEEKIKLPDDFLPEKPLVLSKRGPYLANGTRDDLYLEIRPYYPAKLPEEVRQALLKIKRKMKEVGDVFASS